MQRRTIIAAALAATAAIIGVCVILWVSASGSSENTAGGEAPAPTLSAADRDESAALDRTGQAAGDDFEPLAIPDGIPSGTGVEIPEHQLTQPGTDLSVGDLVIANLFQSEAYANPYVLLMVDEFSAPLEGDARTAAFAEAGMPDAPDQMVQKVTLRLRQIAGTGEMANWRLPGSIIPVNLKFESLAVTDIPSARCGQAMTPLAGHDASTNDTVQVCFYAFGSVNTPGSPVSSLSIPIRIDGKTQYLYVQSDKGLDLGLGDAHAHDHDDEWWEIDPATGGPLVDPETGQVVPKAGHEDHGH